MTKRIVPQYESDLFEWAEKQQAPQWPRNSYNTVDVSNEEFDYQMYKRRIAWEAAQRGEPVEPPPPTKPVFTSLMEYLDDFMPGLLEQADLMHETWRPVQEEDAAIRALRGNISVHTRRKYSHDANIKEPETFTPEDVAEIYDLQDGRCAYCGMPFHERKDFHIDHMTPISKGGTNSPWNIALACVPCNLSKSDHLFEDWRCLRGWY